jgi:hypothetical protein
MKTNINKIYYLGLLGIVPILGIFIGVILLFIGLKQKDRKLILIGLVDILISLAIENLFIKRLENTGFMHKAEERSAQNAINMAAVGIETFKSHNGNYPDSLAQIGPYPKLDPFHFGSQKPVYFNYKKLDIGYILFSPGYDKIPNTGDDIYPQKNIFKDSSKVGLIRPNL